MEVRGGSQVVGDACQQLFPALFVPAGTLHRLLQAGGHLIEGVAHRSKFVLPCIGDPVVQIAVSKPACSLAQQVQRFFDFTDHEPGEKAVGHQNGEEYHKEQPNGRQREEDLQTAVQMLLPGPEEIERPSTAVVRMFGPVYAARSGGEEGLRCTEAVRRLCQPAVYRLFLARVIHKAAVLHHHDAEETGGRHGLHDLHPASPRVRGLGHEFLDLSGHVPADM